MIEQKEYIRAWDERVGEQTSHITIPNIDMLYDIYKKGIFNFDFTTKKVLDYGCGGGWFGKYLFDNFVPKKYIAKDISKRSLFAAKKLLEFVPEELKEFQLILPEQIIFDDVDVLVCFSVIQHFPTLDYFNLFFKILNSSKITTLFLQIKRKEELSFAIEPYKTTHEINRACYTNEKDIKARLSNYKLKHNKKPNTIESDYQYLMLERIANDK